MIEKHHWQRGQVRNRLFLILILLIHGVSSGRSGNDQSEAAKGQNVPQREPESGIIVPSFSVPNLSDKSVEYHTPKTDDIYTVLENDFNDNSPYWDNSYDITLPFDTNFLISSSLITEEFNYDIDSLRADLQSSISSWKISHFSYASVVAVPSALPDFKDNVDYYFIDDSNSTRPLNPSKHQDVASLIPAQRFSSETRSAIIIPSQIIEPSSTAKVAATSSMITETVETERFRTPSPPAVYSNPPSPSSPIDSSAIVNDTGKDTTTKRTPKLASFSTKDDGNVDYRNEIKPSPARRTPTVRPSPPVEPTPSKNDTEVNPVDARMVYHVATPSSNDSISLRSSMGQPVSVHVSLFQDVKGRTDSEENVTRATFTRHRIEEEEEPVKEPKKEESLAVFTMTNLPISSNIIKYTEDVPKMIEPKEPFTFYPDKPKPTQKLTTSKVTTSTHYTLTTIVTPTTVLATPSLHSAVTELSSVTPSSPPPSCGSPNSITQCQKKYPVLVNVTLAVDWETFCFQKKTFQNDLTNILREESELKETTMDQVIFLQSDCADKTFSENKNPVKISVFFLVHDRQGNYDQNMTKTIGDRLKANVNEYASVFRDKLIKVSILTDDAVEEKKSKLTSGGFLPFSESSIITGIVLSVIAAICLVTLSVILLVAKQRGAHSTSASLPPSLMDGLNMDSFPDRGSSTRRKRGRLSLRSFLNQAFDEPEFPSHPLSFSSLTNAINNKAALEEEFKKLPISVPALEEVPNGAETKNRYANVIPNPSTRVRLSPVNNETISEYINANFVKGYGGKDKEYIATQAPLPETVNDFWRMVWEQQSRMILMLTQLEENGASRCAQYFPDNTHDCNRAYGDFQVSLQSKDVRENFVVSTFKLYEIERNLFREVIHLWYTAWPAHKVPEDHSSLLSFILETKKHPVHRSSGPLVVHCSPGTGRTGAVIAIDILMKEYEESRIVDVQRCVSRLRHDRHGAVHTIHQYLLIHEVLHDFIVRQGTSSQRPSLKSLMSLKLH